MPLTAQQIIDKSWGALTGAGPAAVCPATDSAGLLVLLNGMLEMWRQDRLMVYQIVQNAPVSWAAGVPSKTIGSGGVINVERPVKIEAVMVRTATGEDFDVKVTYDRSVYDQEVIKTMTSSIPDYMFVDAGFPLATLYLFPVPDQLLSVYLSVWQIVQSFGTLATAASLPQGYEFALIWNLAETALAYFPNAVTVPLIKDMALRTKRALGTTNAPSMMAEEVEVIKGRGRGAYNINTDRP